MLRVVRVAGGARSAAGELRGHGLAQDDRPGRAQHRRRRRVAPRAPAAVDDGASLGGELLRVDDVLDADRDAPQRAAAVPSRVPRARHLQCDGLVEMGPRPDLAVAHTDAVQARPDQRLRSQRPGRDRACRLRRGQPRRIRQLAHVAPASRRPGRARPRRRPGTPQLTSGAPPGPRATPRPGDRPSRARRRTRSRASRRARGSSGCALRGAPPRAGRPAGPGRGS